MTAHACLLLDQFLYGITRRGGGLFDILHVQLFRLSRLSPALCHGDLLQSLHRIHHDLYGHLPLRTAEHPFPRSVAHHGEAYFHRICRLQVDAELAFQVRHRHLPLCQTGYRHQFEGVFLLIDHLSLEGKAVGKGSHARQEHRQHHDISRDVMFHQII